MGGLPAIWADYNTMDGNGNPVDLSHRRDTYWYMDNGTKVEGKAKNHLTDEEAAQYTLKNVLSGDDNWQPELLTEACAAPEAKVNGNRIEWSAVPYAICYVITKNGKVEGFTTATSCEYAEGNTYAIQAANEYGGLSKATPVGPASSISTPAAADAPFSAKAVYSVDGKHRTAAASGINILTDGQSARKVMMK